MIFGGFYFSFQIYTVERILSRFALDVNYGKAQLVPSNSSNAIEKKLPLIDSNIAVSVKKADGFLNYRLIYVSSHESPIVTNCATINSTNATNTLK
jgi:hypothetical protein